jgi:hypothetical protein
MPSVDESAALELNPAAAYTPPPYALACQLSAVGNVREVQVIPSVDDIALVLCDKETKSPFPKVSVVQLCEPEATEREVQLVPSVEVAPTADGLSEIATKVLFPKAIHVQFEVVGIVRAVQVVPSVEDAARFEPLPATTAKMLNTGVTLLEAADAADVPFAFVAVTVNV